MPLFAHIPLIHGADGAKLSKRHGALGVDAYRDMGYLPEAVRNYLLRLGWSHGDEETISTEQAIEWFDLPQVGRSPARFDFAKLDNLNAHYIRLASDERLVELVLPRIEAALGSGIEAAIAERLRQGMNGLKQRVKTLAELVDMARPYVARPTEIDEKASKQLDPAGRALLASYSDAVGALEPWAQAGLEDAARQLAERAGVKLGQVAQPLRAALTGRTISPPIFEVMEILGRTETLARLAAQGPQA